MAALSPSDNVATWQVDMEQLVLDVPQISVPWQEFSSLNSAQILAGGGLSLGAQCVPGLGCWWGNALLSQQLGSTDSPALGGFQSPALICLPASCESGPVSELRSLWHRITISCNL